MLLRSGAPGAEGGRYLDVNDGEVRVHTSMVRVRVSQRTGVQAYNLTGVQAYRVAGAHAYGCRGALLRLQVRARWDDPGAWQQLVIRAVMEPTDEGGGGGGGSAGGVLH